MMVQSKTIVKKHNGELGSKGSFQWNFLLL
jgi:hypothetical protein